MGECVRVAIAGLVPWHATMLNSAVPAHAAQAMLQQAAAGFIANRWRQVDRSPRMPSRPAPQAASAAPVSHPPRLPHRSARLPTFLVAFEKSFTQSSFITRAAPFTSPVSSALPASASCSWWHVACVQLGVGKEGG